MRALLIVALVSTPAVAQQVATRTLTKPDAEYSEPFTRLTGFRELRDGRVLVSDQRDKTLQAIDLKTGSAVAIGREGSGPMEWSLPGRLVGMPGDTTLMSDAFNSRFLVIGPDGKAVSTLSPVVEGSTGSTGGTGGRGGPPGAGAGAAIVIGGRGAMAVLNARATDAKGRFYFTGSSVTMGPSGPMAADSVPLIRSDISGKTQDTLAWLRVAKANVSGSNAAGQTSIRIGAPPPFQSGDDWSVFADGRVAIARVADYHIDIIQPDGRRVSGTPYKYTPVKIGEGEKEEWRSASRNAQTMNTTNNNGAITRSVGSAAGTPVQDPPEWPAAKSAFLNGSTWAAPNGDTWVFPARAASDHTPVAQVFNARGQLAGKVVLPADTRVVGFGAKSVYLARTDKDDLQYLQRYSMAW